LREEREKSSKKKERESFWPVIFWSQKKEKMRLQWRWFFSLTMSEKIDGRLLRFFFLFLHQNKKEIHEKGLGIWLKKYFFSFLIQIIIFYKKISTLNTFFFCIQETMFMSKKQYKNKKRYLSKKRFFFSEFKALHLYKFYKPLFSFL